MSAQSQISVIVSATTKEKLDRFTENLGLKKNYVVEHALLYYMEARRELPDEAFIPTRIVLENESFDRLMDMQDQPPAPTKALKDLMRGSDS